MTQILLCSCEHGIAMASDSRAVAFGPDGEARSFIQLNKVFRLGPHAVVLTAGAGYGVFLCEQFETHLRETGVEGFAEISERALSYFGEGLTRLRAERLLQIARPELDRVYFLMAGHVSKEGGASFQFALLGSEAPSDPVHVIPTGPVVAIPRQPMVEHRLAHRSQPFKSLDEVEGLLEMILLKLAQVDDEIGPPFHFIRITPREINMRTKTP